MDVNLTGLPALLAIVLVFYVFVYLPLKLVTTLVSHAKQKAYRIEMLKKQTVIAEYEPPAGLTPAEVGFLLDSKLEPREIFATIVYLGQAGAVELAEDQDKFVVAGLNPNVQMGEFEKHVFNQLTRLKGKVIDRGTVKKMHLRAEVAINDDLRAQGYLVSAGEQMKRSFLRIAVFTATLMVLTVLFVKSDSISTTLFFLFFFSPVYFAVGLALFVVYVKIGGATWLGSKMLKEIWPEIEGFREYIRMVEADKLEFESENAKELIKNKALPYSIALGFNDE